MVYIKIFSRYYIYRRKYLQRNVEKYLIEGSELLGISLNSVQLNLFLQYFNILLEWNSKINLTSIKNPKEIIVKHFLDSLTCVSIIKSYINNEVNWKKEISIIDIGTGAGFPGIPLKIVIPTLKMTLLEAKEKKIVFLKELVKILAVSGVEIINSRAEIIGKKNGYRESYDISISRAVAPLFILGEYSLPLVKINGWFISQKGKEYRKELKSSVKALKLLGGELIRIENICLPILKQERNILIIKKMKHTPDKYPRRNGLPKKRPLNI